MFRTSVDRYYQMLFKLNCIGLCHDSFVFILFLNVHTSVVLSLCVLYGGGIVAESQDGMFYIFISILQYYLPSLL